MPQMLKKYPNLLRRWQMTCIPPHWDTFHGMPSDFALKTMNAVHRSLLKISGGRAGWNVSNMPVLELTTTGRKSGQPRAVMLTSPLQEGNVLVVVASRGGDDLSLIHISEPTR